MAGIRKILYFIKGGTPTQADITNALKCGTQAFRNAQAFSSFDFIEQCDGVAGCAPEAYLKRFPRVDAPVEPPAPPPPPPPPPPAPVSPTPSTEVPSAPPPWKKV